MVPEIVTVPELADATRYGYAQCLRHDGIVYVAGQTGVDAAFATVGPDIASQARQAFTNVAHALRAAGSDWAHTLRLEVFLTDMARDFRGYAQVKAEILGGALIPGQVLEVKALAMPDLVIEVAATAAVAR